ncbi:MAG: VWA domain-containing protein [Polyangiaceae bacterium]|nr:VWA domain-containing protein [Polyangiaceae bacterium]
MNRLWLPSWASVRPLVVSVGFCTVATALLSAAAGCGAGTEDDQAGGGSSTSGFTTGSGGGFGGEDPGCASIDQQAVARPLNLYIMLDRSSSMAGSKWDAAKAGLEAFLQDPASDGIDLGFRSFPEGAPGCDQTVYQDPAVGWAELPGVGQDVITALASLAPDGFSTPMYQALGGALLECIERKSDAPDEEAAVLLVTDGAPQGPTGTCGGVDPEDSQAIANLAAAALEYGVTTFVIGLPGVDQSFANLVAAEGGSEEAILVGTTNVESEFRDALAKVRGDLLPCEYFIPEEVRTGEVGLTFVNVALGFDGADPEITPQNPECDGEGWHYDDPSEPTTIILCPKTCEKVKSDTSASISIALGCQTIVK